MQRKLEEEKQRMLEAEKDYTDPEELSEEVGGDDEGADADDDADAAGASERPVDSDSTVSQFCTLVIS
ncbi:hypothetical protein ACET3Z_013331 [Daucus carota]